MESAFYYSPRYNYHSLWYGPNEYEAADGSIIYHFDCYRINKIQEALDLGAEEYLYSGNYCFIEWSENIASLLPDNTVNVDIEETEKGVRMVTIVAPAP